MKIRVSRRVVMASAAAALASCSVYGEGLLGSGGSSASSAPAGSSTSAGAGAGGAGGAGGGDPTGPSTTSSTSTTTTSTTSTTTTSSTTGTSSTTTTTSSSTTTTTSSTTSTSSSTSSSGSTCSGNASDVLLLSQIKTRGLSGGNDEWVELYNPGASPVTFDATWALKVRSAVGGVASCTTNNTGIRFNGGCQVIPSHGHLLYANSAGTGYSEQAQVPEDGTYTTGITDASSVLLFHGSALIDALCFYFDSTTEASFAGCSAAPYTCSGAPVMNPHDNTSASDNNKSLERKPGGSGGNAMNTHDNSSDFAVNPTADPHDLASPPAP